MQINYISNFLSASKNIRPNISCNKYVVSSIFPLSLCDNCEPKSRFSFLLVYEYFNFTKFVKFNPRNIRQLRQKERWTGFSSWIMPSVMMADVFWLLLKISEKAIFCDSLRPKAHCKIWKINNIKRFIKNSVGKDGNHGNHWVLKMK